MANDDDGDDVAEMRGKIVAWNGRNGLVETTSGERVPLARGQLSALGFRGPVKTGDRIHFHASRQVEVTYHVKRIRLIIPATSEPKPKTKSPRRRNVRAEIPRQVFTGVIETFNASKGHGYVRTSCDQLLLLHITCLRASGYQAAPLGVRLSFEALQRPKGWHVVRVLPAAVSK